MNLLTKQKDSQMQKIHLWLPKGKGLEGDIFLKKKKKKVYLFMLRRKKYPLELKTNF